MIIDYLSAAGVFGRLNFEIHFNSDVSIIYGVNGCGKTTILNLIDSMLSLDIERMSRFRFDNAEIVFRDGENQQCLEAIYGLNGISVYMNGEVVVKNNNYEMRQMSLFDAGRRIVRQNSRHKHQLGGRGIDKPLMLGIERVSEMLSVSNRSVFRSKRDPSNIDLNKIESLVVSTYGQLRSHEKKMDERLKLQIIASSFGYKKVTNINTDIDLVQKIRSAIARRQEIEVCLAGIDLSANEIQKAASSFFDSLIELAERLEHSQSVSSNAKDVLELMSNEAQIDRLIDLIGVIEDDKKRRENLFRPINAFLEEINSYFAYTGKNATIDQIGKPYVLTSKKEPLSISELSSGEKQLIVMLAYASFGKFDNVSSVVMIDEPELSLHLGWQSMLVASLQRCAKRSQLILATHSPEIVGSLSEKCVEVL